MKKKKELSLGFYWVSYRVFKIKDWTIGEYLGNNKWLLIGTSTLFETRTLYYKKNRIKFK